MMKERVSRTIIPGPVRPLNWGLEGPPQYKCSECGSPTEWVLLPVLHEAQGKGSTLWAEPGIGHHLRPKACWWCAEHPEG